MRLLDRLRRIQWRAALLPTAMVVLAALVIYVMVGQAAANERQRLQYEALTASYAELYEEAVVAGADPESPAPEDVPEPDDSAPQIELPEPGPSGAPGARGPGPTQAQVVQALSTYCASNDCSPTPTVAQVAAAISDYCAGGACQGEDGSDGSDGANGEPGRPPTAEEIAAAVTAYCSGGACRGEDGNDGERGPPPTDQQVLDQVRIYCSANNDCQGDTGDRGPQGTATPGDYTCPDGEVMRGFSVAEDGTVTLACEDTTPPIIETP